jgi:hypothetical protein
MKMKRVLYVRCNGGHYFRGERRICPFDAWKEEWLDQIPGVLKLLVEAGVPLSLEALKSNGLSVEQLRRVVIMEFGDENCAFDALAPSYYFIDGQTVKMHEVGLNLM